MTSPLHYSNILSPCLFYRLFFRHTRYPLGAPRQHLATACFFMPPSTLP
ncbi:uncharacterized protein ACO6RY_17124 [Pungitius sinensis]